jgi:hypothetical protein
MYNENTCVDLKCPYCGEDGPILTIKQIKSCSNSNVIFRCCNGHIYDPEKLDFQFINQNIQGPPFRLTDLEVYKNATIY